MPVLHLVRHGQAAAGWDADPDPGLSDLGRDQARAVAARLAADLAPREVVVSPLRRTRETAAPLGARWGSEPVVTSAVGEIPSPGTDLSDRGPWLDRVLRSTWDEVDDGAVHAWRSGLLDWLRACTRDTVVVTHFVAINAVVGEADGSDAVTTFLPANASVTVIDVDRDTGRLHVLARGEEAAPVVR